MDKYQTKITNSVSIESLIKDSDEDSLLLEEVKSHDIYSFTDSDDYNSNIEDDLLKDLSSESSIYSENNSCVDNSNKFEIDDLEEYYTNTANYISRKCIYDIYLNNKTILEYNDKMKIDFLDINDCILLEPYLHHNEELENLYKISRDKISNIRIDNENDLVLTGNKNVFAEDTIELSSNNSGSPSSIHHDSNGLLFIGTIKGYCIITLDINVEKHILVNPVEDLFSKITSITTFKHEDKNYIYVSVARVDGSIYLWKLNIKKTKCFLKADINKNLDIFNVECDINEDQEILNHNSNNDLDNKTDYEVLFNNKTICIDSNNKKNGIIDLLSKNSKHIRDGILNHEFIDIRNQDIKNKLAMFICDLQGNLFVTIFKMIDDKWEILENIFLYRSDEELIHEFKCLPSPPIIKYNSVDNKLQNNNTIKRDIIFMDHYQFYLINSRKTFSIISMLPYPALCKVVNIVEDLKSRNITIQDNEVNILYSNWLRPNVITINNNSNIKNQIPVKIVATINKYFCIYEITSFQKFRDSSEIDIELNLVKIWRLFDVINGMQVINDSIVVFLMGLNGIYVYQIMDNYNGFHCTTKIQKNDDKLEIIESYNDLTNIVGKKLDNISPIIKVIDPNCNELLACIYKYSYFNRKLFVVSQNITNDLQETISLFGQSLIYSTSNNHINKGKVNKIILLLNDKIMIFTMLFKSWVPYLEHEYNNNIEDIKNGSINILSWIKLSTSFIALYENRLPPLSTWNNFSENMIPIILKNIFNSLLDNFINNSKELESFNYNMKQIVKLIFDSSIRLKLWDYLFNEIIPIIRSFNNVQILINITENSNFNVTLFDYFIQILIYKFLFGDIKWEYMNIDLLKIIIIWYKSQILKLDEVSDSKVQKQILLHEIQYLMIRTLNIDINNPWLIFVPLFKKNNIWTSYIILYLYSNKNPIELLKKIILLLYEYSASNIESKNDIINYQYKLENEFIVQNFFHYIYSLIFQNKYPFSDIQDKFEFNESQYFVSVDLRFEVESFINLFEHKLMIDKTKQSKNCCEILMMISYRLYIFILIELRKRICLFKVNIQAQKLIKNERNTLFYERLMLLMEKELELYIYNLLNRDSRKERDILINSFDEDVYNIEIIKFKIFDLVNNGRVYNETFKYYLLGHYLIWILLSLDRYNLNNEMNYNVIIKSIFIVIENLYFNIELSKNVLYLVKNIEYYLIMAIINSNKNNEGINFLNILLNCNSVLQETKIDRSSLNNVEINQKLSPILKKYSLYNLSLYLSIQVYDLENILDIFSKKHFINNNILKELYVMDEENNNILFSFNYIINTIEKGIKFNIFNYDQVFKLIIKYTDLLVDIDSLNTIDLIIYILNKCLNNEYNYCENNIDYYEIIRKELNYKIYKLLLSTLLFNNKNLYKEEMNSDKWNGFINQIIPHYLIIYIKDNKNNDINIMKLLNYWYKSSQTSNQLINLPFNNCFFICKEYNNIYGMIYINHIFINNTSLNKNEYETVSNTCIMKFENDLLSINNMLLNKYNQDSFIINTKKIEMDKVLLFLIIQEENPDKEDFFKLWNNLIQFLSFLFLYCFSNHQYLSLSNEYNPLIYLYMNVIKILFLNIDKYVNEYNQTFMDIFNELIKKNCSKISKNGYINIKGHELMIILYYILIFYILGSQHYLHIMEKYITKFNYLSDFLFNNKINKIFSDSINNYYNLIKPILQLIIKHVDNIPCKFWRHLTMNMINTKLFADKCNDEVTFLFQNDLLYIFNSLINNIKRATNIQLFDIKNTISDKYINNYDININSCCYCLQPLNKNKKNNFSEEKEKIPSFNLNIVSNGINNFSLDDLTIHFKKPTKITEDMSNYNNIQSEYNTNDNNGQLYIFHCGNVFHKRCFYNNTNVKFGQNRKKPIYCDEKDSIKKCLHQYIVSFN